MIIYKPITENEDSKVKYITENDFEKQLKDMDDKYITGDELKDRLKNVNSKDIKDLKEDVKTLKRKLEDIADDLKYKKEYSYRTAQLKYRHPHSRYLRSVRS